MMLTRTCSQPLVGSRTERTRRIQFDRSILILVVLSIAMALTATNVSGQEDSSHQLSWSDSKVDQTEIDSLSKCMASIGLRPMRDDSRIFQPAPGRAIQLERIPAVSPPFGLHLASFNSTEEQLVLLKTNNNLFSMTLHGFQDADVCLQAVRGQTNLRFLSMSECAIDDEKLSRLSTLKQLETLDLRRTQVRGSGLAELKCLPALQSLEVDMSVQQFQTLIVNQLVHLLPIAHGKNRTTATTDADVVELELNGFYGYPVTNEMLQNIERLTSLRELSLIESQVNNDAIPQLIRLKKLEKLNLERTRIDDEALRVLANARQLKSLVLDETRITSRGLKHLEKLENLTEVRLNRCKLDDASLHALTILARLERLEIGKTEIRFEHNLEPGSFAKLEHLNVNGSTVTDSGIAKIAQLPELKWLDMTLCRVSDEGIESLAACKKLEVLYLNLTSIGDDALRHLAMIRTLQELSLHSTAITDAGLRHLSGMKGLRSLILLGTQTSQSAVQQLHLELPDCEIVR